MGVVGVSFKMRKRREIWNNYTKRWQRRRAARFHQSFPCMVLDGCSREALRPPHPRLRDLTPHLRGLTHHLKLIIGQRFLRFSILKETPTAPQAFLVPLCPVKDVGLSQHMGREGTEIELGS